MFSVFKILAKITSKIGWRIIKEGDSMWARILKAKYLDNNDLERLVIVQDPCRGSSLWNHIINKRGVLWKGD